MSDLKPQIGHLTLNQLAIPGTHDTGTYSLDSNSRFSVDFFMAAFQTQADQAIDSFDKTGILTGVFNDAFNGAINPLIYKWAVAQDKSIADQLNAGIRYFDIRPCPYPDPGSATDIRICHSLFGAKVTDVMAGVKQFSLSHPDEIIIMDFNHITSHKITGALSSQLATSIVQTFSNVSTGDMLMPVTSISPTSTLAQIWGQPARIIVLYDDQDLPSSQFDGLLWPGQDVPSNSPLGGPARIHSPWPGENNAAAQLTADIAYLQCRCDNPKLPDDTAPDALFVLQTNATPDVALLGGNLIDEIESSTSVPVLGCILCPALDPLRDALNLASHTPRDLRDLADQANTKILPTIMPAILSSQGALRKNLNIVQADRFEEEYDTAGNVVPSGFVDFMIRLNTPPQSVLSIGTPQFSGAQQLFVSSKTPISIQASDSYFGVQSISYDYSSTGFDSKLQQVSGSNAKITMAAPAPDGAYKITSFSTNAAGLSEGVNTKQGVTLDNTPPVITITQPATVAYPHSSTLTLNYGVSDGAGSGVQSVTPSLMDGAPAVGGQTLANGQVINLLTQLALGSHTFVFGGATDKLGNSSPAQSVTFNVVATADSIKGDVTQFVASGAIIKANWATSLSTKLNDAANARSAGDCSTAASIYNAFIHEVSAQTGKAVTPTAAAIMTADAQYMIAHCP